jgi:serine phosphatase RsbU (regulator of sigma subunit)
MSLLKQYLLEGQVNSPAEALDHLNQKLSIMLRQQDKDEVKDGMDITYCMIDYKTLKLSYAGAHNPLWIVKRSKATNLNNRSASKIKNTDVHKYELIEIKADKQPIGYSDSPRPFTNHEIQLEPGDTFYIFSDGYADQFGGPKGKKFKTSKLKELLISIQDNNLTTQKDLLIDAFKFWQGDQEQVDDVCFMGVRV